MLGLNKGALLLTALQKKGRVIQHITDHIDTSHIITLDHNELESLGIDIKNLQEHQINSIIIQSNHHQLMYPFDVENYKILGYSNGLSSTYLNGNNEEIELKYNTNKLGIQTAIEPEIVFYPDTKCLCLQGIIEDIVSNTRELNSYQFINTIIYSTLIDKLLLKNEQNNFLNFLTIDTYNNILNTPNFTKHLDYINLIVSNFTYKYKTDNKHFYIQPNRLQRKSSENLSITKQILTQKSRKSLIGHMPSPYDAYKKTRLTINEEQPGISLRHSNTFPFTKYDKDIPPKLSSHEYSLLDRKSVV